ncbi:hypothetical protein JG687_00017894 [Phytophthora cactorum]|uniref:SCAN domain-containing protein n=1 Tax=Phytophthora cactorum TaxID=29920 RepID=A0A8T1TNW3_9STRA|nr:hypothetical protein GQ600_886 [Phytophthora cactorum]KAG6944397.1 hypothetical protein JG687_00017894 [Phytophthora cactorum]
MPVTTSTAPRGGCCQPVGPVHRCPKCSRHMHPFCGRPTRNEGCGHPVVCPECDRPDQTSQSAPVNAATSRDVGVMLNSDSEVELDSSQSIYRQPRQSSRRTQAVSSIAHRRKVVRWMEEYEATSQDKGIFPKAVDTFPAVSNSATRVDKLSQGAKQVEKTRAHTGGRSWCSFGFSASAWR